MRRIGSVFLFYVLFIVGALLIQCFYLALVTRHVTGNTTLGSQLRFGSSITAGRLLGMMLGNLAIIVFTLGSGFADRAASRDALRGRYAAGVRPARSADARLKAIRRRRARGEGMLNLLDHGGAF